jgi:hypothetical protein
VAKGKKLWGVGPGGAGMPCTSPVLFIDRSVPASTSGALDLVRRPGRA